MDTIAKLEEFLAGTPVVMFSVVESKDERYKWVEKTLLRFRYQRLCERAFVVFQDSRYERLAEISVSHLYNLRKTKTYKRSHLSVEKTRPARVSIGERRKPKADGKPGYIRIDTVHQGDLEGEKGVYHINAVDEVTQFEVVASVEKIGEHFLIPCIEMILDAFPFEIKGFHSDHGSEFINYKTAEIIPCLFPKSNVNENGKIKKQYPCELISTPYEKLKSLPNAASCLKPEITFEMLDKIAYKFSDNEAASLLNEAQRKLFEEIMNTKTRSA
ncbi:MAG: hypothetical protein ACK5NT_07035 [Pyrinomonadaceae bacterium]